MGGSTVNTLEFIIGSLATFRVATMIAQEKGPGFMFCKLRNLPKKGSATHQGISCPLCVSVYVATFFSALFWNIGLIQASMILPCLLAFSGVSVALSLTVSKDL